MIILIFFARIAYGIAFFWPRTVKALHFIRFFRCFKPKRSVFLPRSGIGLLWPMISVFG